MPYGALVVGGFDGPELPGSFARALREGRRGGAILFKRNVPGGPAQVAALARSIHEAAPGGLTLLGIDQEGGRVARLGRPLLEVPPMRTVGAWGDADFAERLARAVGGELGALGLCVVFAPVLDVDTRDDNPVIGDRAFSGDPDVCARMGAAWTRGLQSAGVLACGKHFPGHGDTSKDSHVDLPVVEHPLERLERIELVPFRAAAAAGLATMMTAHVVYPALDRALPATLSRAISTGLRGEVGFEGLLVSDDLEMRAVAARWSIEESAVLAVAAGCDVLLVCWSQDLQERAVDALEREASRSPAFRARCDEALRRRAAALARITSRAEDEATFSRRLAGESRAVAEELARRASG